MASRNRSADGQRYGGGRRASNHDQLPLRLRPAIPFASETIIHRIERQSETAPDRAQFRTGCSRQEGQADLSAVGLAKVECQHANASSFTEPTAGQAAPTSAWSCRHCPQDCAPAVVATLGLMPPPPGQGLRRFVAPLQRTSRNVIPNFGLDPYRA